MFKKVGILFLLIFLIPFTLAEENTIKAVIFTDNPSQYSGTELNSINAVEVELTQEQLEEVKSNPDINQIYIENTSFEIKLSNSVPSLNVAPWWNNNLFGGNVKVAVIDTGIKTAHYALNRTLFNQTRNILSQDFAQSGTIEDTHGHGTHVAGIIASSDSFSTGVAPGISTLINAKIFNGATSNNESAALFALEWAAEQGADVISNSWGCGDWPTYQQYYDNCFKFADGKTFPWTLLMDALVDDYNLVNIVSAGNEGVFNQPLTITAPGDSYNSLTIGAIDDKNTINRSDDTFWSVSSIGPTIDGRKKPDLVSPGVLINSSWIDGKFISISGTSMAAPHISGAAALLKSYYLSSKEIRALLINTAEDKGPLNWDPQYGWGLIDLNKSFYSKDLTLENSIANNSYQFYKINNASRITLVWNKHYQENLSNLNIFSYNLLDNQLISSSASQIDNVEQISTLDNNIIKINATLENRAIEDYALASNTQLNLVSAPGFIFNVSTSSINSTVNFSLTVINLGDIPAHNLNVTLNIPQGLSSNNLTKTLSYLDSNSTLDWLINSTANGEFLVNVTLISDSYGEIFSADNTYLIIFNNISINNTSPQITSINPSSNLTIYENETLTFNYTSIDAENNSLTTLWLLDSQPQSNETSWTFAPHSPGNFTINLIVSDGEFNVSNTWLVQVISYPQTTVSTPSSGGGGGGGGGSSDSRKSTNESKVTPIKKTIKKIVEEIQEAPAPQIEIKEESKEDIQPGFFESIGGFLSNIFTNNSITGAAVAEQNKITGYFAFGIVVFIILAIILLIFIFRKRK